MMIPVKKCKVDDCYRIDLYYDKKKGDEPEYCIEHAAQYRLVNVKTGRKPLCLCKSVGFINIVLATQYYRKYRRYCYDYSVIEYHNNNCADVEGGKKYSKCSDVHYLQCMYPNCFRIPHRVIYGTDRKGYYCIEHWEYLMEDLYSPLIPGTEQYVPIAPLGYGEIHRLKFTNYVMGIAGLSIASTDSYYGRYTDYNVMQKEERKESRGQYTDRGQYMNGEQCTDKRECMNRGQYMDRDQTVYSMESIVEENTNVCEDYLPDSDDWIEYALEHISFCT